MGGGTAAVVVNVANSFTAAAVTVATKSMMTRNCEDEERRVVI